MTDYELIRVLENARDLSKIDLLRFFKEFAERIKKIKDTAKAKKW